MHKECYLFLIWNKAFFCKDKILKDLKSSFLIRKTFYIRWSEENFLKNLKAFYGTKTADVKEKARYVGKDLFYVIFVEDPDPLFEQRKTYNGSETVNARIYDKKWLYRKWTGGNFRVHSSQDKKETEHDLTVLLGPDFMKRIDACTMNGMIETDTKGILGFASLQEFKDALGSFSRNVILEDQERVTVLTECRSDLECFLGLEQSGTYHHRLKVGDGDYDLCLLGEAEGDLPEGFLTKISDDPSMGTDFLKVKEDYLEFLHDRLKISDPLRKYMGRYGFSFDFEKKDPFRKESAKSLFRRCKDELKYRYLILRESFQNE
ncbi:MAG: hypothetical protein IJI44_02055 [Erysipelotrichaceae bacterium]|nr:hypothetical protein [Erysipelotrichaceae bacterium]